MEAVVINALTRACTDLKEIPSMSRNTKRDIEKSVERVAKIEAAEALTVLNDVLKIVEKEHGKDIVAAAIRKVTGR